MGTFIQETTADVCDVKKRKKLTGRISFLCNASERLLHIVVNNASKVVYI